MELIELTDGVVHLRAPDDRDVDAIAALCQDPAIQEFTTVPSPYGRADGEGFVRQVVPAGWSSGTNLTWSVRDAATDRLDGMIGLLVQPPGSAEIGYWLGAHARGRGLMSRATALVVDLAFDPERLGLERLSWTGFTHNVASRRVAERAGFHIEGHIRGYALQRGGRRDAWVGTLLATDARPVRPAVDG
ncbi:GNAT family N-acetyltransferase (plasmid) [Cellulomonas sp. WB94]|uniref:GNAT family N-acetyltransferase n=1 Tax=Cellulomonas sp. WB94 TaxID=2173174 RepID=UPI000D568610|nr:GNAT family protein [Cellulomonas sp. WB94]PVU81527.1 GNAT family N-acetyltransferase [Cellulomonas sp. WB94]